MIRLIAILAFGIFLSCSGPKTEQSNQEEDSNQSDVVLVSSNDSKEQENQIDTTEGDFNVHSSESNSKAETVKVKEIIPPTTTPKSSKKGKSIPSDQKNDSQKKETPPTTDKGTAAVSEPIEVKKEEVKEILETKNTEPQTVDHSQWDRLLQKYVTASGKVNYKGIKQDKASLEAYLKDLTQNPIQNSWSRNEKMAYWINAYNAFTIKLIIDNYPVSSITKLHNGKPWDVAWIKLGSKSYTLNNIENDILRPQFKDARIHFAVNCAAKSCPPIINRAWTASNLSSLFNKQAKSFINNSSFNSISPDKVEISKIFEWYAGDFGNIIDYLNKFSKVKINSNATVTYKEYDWALNE